MANNKNLSTNLATSPYYDDFDPTKNYVRILFKPSLAVQARELTQIQSTLQKQIGYNSEHLFAEGAVVKNGKLNIDFDLWYLKIKDNDTFGNPITVSELMNKTITSANTGVKALVMDYSNGSESSDPNTKMLYVKYQSASPTDGNTFYFLRNETIVANNGVTFTSLDSNTAIGFSSSVTITDGVMYAKGHFIYFPAQTLIIDKFTNHPTCRVGFDLIESIVDSDDDPTLLDPASGTTNYAAPGADRIKITPQLVAYDDPNDITEDFVELANIVDGVVQSMVTKTEYSVIKDEFARRTYDESGNYSVKGLTIHMRESLNDGSNFGMTSANNGGNASTLSIGIEPGKAYVYGYEVEKLTTQYIQVDKGIDYKTVESQNIAANYGNYVLVNELVGSIDLNSGSLVQLLDTAETRISNLEYSPTSPSGNVIGTAILKTIELDTGLPGKADTIYKAYLTNIKMTTGNFSEVKCIYKNNTSTADVVMDIVGIAELKEKSFNSHIYSIPTPNIRKIRDSSDEIETSFIFKKTFNVSITTSGTFTLNTGSSDEIFPFGAGALNSSQKNNNFLLSLNTAATVSMSGTVAGTNGTSDLVGSGTTFTNLNVGDKITVNTQTAIIASITSNTSLTIVGTWIGDFSSETYVKQYFIGDVIDLNSKGASGTVRSITVNSATSAAFELKETLSSTISASLIVNLSKTNAREIKKLIKRNRLVQIDCSTHSANTLGPWNLGFSDVIKINSVRLKTGDDFDDETDGTLISNGFTLDNGQRDDIYDQAMLVKKQGQTLSSSDKLLINLDYYYHDTTQGVGYLSVDSYPIDDVNGSANTSAITTSEIPLFTSPVTGVVYDLRDSIDTRNAKVSTAVDATTIGTMSTNPVASTTLVSPVSGIHTPTPNQSFMIDYSYYLPRIDLIVIDSGGLAQSVRGIPSIKPVTPSVPADSMAFAELLIAPYPSLPPSLATLKKRPNYANKVKNVAIKRYTMAQIGTLERRIENLEYYTALNLLEKATLDTKILDDSGLDRFKNGILVDPFDDHSIGDTENPDYNIAVDPKKSEIRPKFTLDDIGNKFVSVEGAAKNGNLITMPYDSIPHIQQLSAVTTRNAAGLFYSYKGSITLNPESDYWTNTNQIPDLQIDNENDLSNWQNLADAWGTEWGDWETKWTSTESTSTKSGRTTTNTKTTTIEQTRTGESLGVTSSTTTQNYGDRVIDTSVIPYMREMAINFEAHGLKPNTILYASFDNEPVNYYITPAGGYAMGDALFTDENGYVAGVFNLPNDENMRFRTGTKMFRLTDNPNLFLETGLVTTYAEIPFTASGLNQTKQGTIVSTVSAVVAPVTTIDDRTQTTSSTSSVTTNPPYNPPSSPPPTVVTKPPLPVVDRNSAAYLAGIRDAQVPKPVVVVPPTQPSIVIVDPPPPPRPVITFPVSGAGQHGGDRGSDPIAQTFKVVVPDSVPGAFFTQLDLYFGSKHPIFGVEIEFRELNSGGYLTKNVVPYSKIRIPSSDINVSNDASVKTSITLPSPIFLLADTEYAFVIRPEADNDLTTVWVSKLGGQDIITGAIITKQPYTGVVFASANDSTWEPIQDEDIKFVLHRAKFTTGYGSVNFSNESIDYLKLTDFNTAFQVTGEEIRGLTKLNVTGVTGGTIANTDIIVGQTSGTYGSVVSSVSNVIKLNRVTVNKMYDNDEDFNVLYANGQSKSVSGTITSSLTPVGNLFKYHSPETNNILIDVKRTNDVPFTVGEEIRTSITNSFGTISEILNKKMNLLNVQSSEINLSGTSVDWMLKTTSNNSILDSDFIQIVNNKNHTLNDEKLLMSISNELSNLSGAKSLQTRARLFTSSDYISPVVDVSRCHTIFVHNIVNNDATGEDKKSGGNALAKYISQKVTLAEDQDAEDVKVYITGYRPITSNILVYMKALHRDDSDIFENLEWSQLEMTSKNLYSSNENIDDFKEFEFSIPNENLSGDNDEYQYVNSAGITYTGYKYFAIKIVLLSSNSVYVPRCKDARVICLQK